MKKDFSVLLVDDEEGILEGLSKVLSLNGYTTDTAATGSEAVRKLTSGSYDLSFIDLKLPDMDGVEVVRSIQPYQNPLVIMTAYASVETAVSSMKIGVADYIKKPFDNDSFLAIAERFYKKKKLPYRSGIEVKNKNEVILKSRKILEVYEAAEKIKDYGISVLLTGESGTGKEVFSRLIHERSYRNCEPFIGINCSAIPSELLESELFGYERGAFSGALRQKRGKFECAGKGTLFLDEIGDMEFRLQSKLLRVLEEKTFERLGGTNPIPFRARIIASTNLDLKKMVAQKRFRSDLYFRLKGLQLELPPLRERKEDLESLAVNFVNHFSKICGKEDLHISTEAMNRLKEYPWPGNIRELKNAAESAVLLSGEKRLLLSGDFRLEPVEEEMRLVDDLEREHILRVLEDNKFNRSMAAQELQISRKTLYNKIRKYSL